MTEEIDKINLPMKSVVTGIYKIKGFGKVILYQVEQGIVKHGDKIIFPDKNIKHCITFSLTCGNREFEIDGTLQIYKPGDNFATIGNGADNINLIQKGDIIVHDL